MGLSRWCKGSLDNCRRNIGVGIGINRRRIPVPSRTYDPPPTKPIPVPSVKPVATAPNDDIVFMEMVDAAMPVGSWSSLAERRQRGSRQYDG